VTGVEQRVLPCRWLTVFAVGVCALIAALVRFPTFSCQLVWDDVDIITQSQSLPLQAFARSFWHGGSGVMGDDPYHRPLSSFSLGLDELVAVHRAWFYSVNLLLHAAALALAGIVLWQVFVAVWPVLAGGRCVRCIRLLLAAWLMSVAGPTS
jgi:cytochrome b subunit of formate dehydrogenase